jgi:putative NAD(P)-binding protein
VPRRIIIFGATGFTGRQVAERLAVQGAAPVLAGRSEGPLRELAERLGVEWRQADALRPNSVFALLENGDVLVSTVGPFVKWGEPAVRAAIAAGGTYIDSTGEPAFVRRVFDEFGPPAARAGATLLTAMGYDFVPGALAAGLALQEAGDAAVRVDVGYYAFGMRPSGGTRASSVGIVLDDGHAFRDGAVKLVRNGERVRSFQIRGKDRPGLSVGGAEHLTLPASYPQLREVNTYLGWFGSLAKPLQAASLVGSVALRVPGARLLAQATGDRLAGMGSDPEPGSGVSAVAAEAFDERGTQLSRVELTGPEPYTLTADLIAWAARHDAEGTGALGPLQAYGLAALEEGAREAGLIRAAP